MPSSVHDSALIVNAFRARKRHVSHDKFAALWISEESEKWANNYAESVGSTEILVHSLRHRFFLEYLIDFSHSVVNGVFINIGAGYTNYPYLISPDMPCCEIDTSMCLDFKQQKLAEFEASRLIPSRTIKFIAVNNINDLVEIQALKASLKEWVGDRPSFVLFEGVFFYLSIKAIKELFKMLSSLQTKGSLIGCTSFRPEEVNKLMFNRLLKYCRRGYKMKDFEPTTIPKEFYREQDGYSLISTQNYYNLCEKLSLNEQLGQPQEVLEEDVYILEKQ